MSAPRPTIVLVHHGGELYGSGTVLLRAARELAARARVVAVLGGQGPLVEALAAHVDVVHVIDVGARHGQRAIDTLSAFARIPGCVHRLNRIVREEHPDVVLSNSAGVVTGAITARMLGVPHVWYVHEVLTGSGPLVGLLRRAICSSGAVIAVSETCAASIATRGRCRSRLVVLPNVVDPPPAVLPVAGVREESGIPQDAFVASVIGRIHPRKGLDIAIEAMEMVTKLRRDAHLVIAGGAPGQEPYRERLRELVRTSGLDAHVRFLGFREDIWAVLRASDVLLLPSVLPESCGLSVLEAASAALPVVASAVGGVCDLIEDGRTGYLVPAGDPTALADKILGLAADRELRHAMGVAAREMTREHFSPEAYGRELWSVIESATGQSR